MGKTDSAIVGLPELTERLKALAQGLYSQDAVTVYLAAAKRIRDAARREAPVSRWPIASRGKFETKDGKLRFAATEKNRAPGALRKAVEAQPARRYAEQLGPAAYVVVNAFRGRNRAPHAHLVAFGTQERTNKGKLMAFPALGGGRWIFTRRVRGVTPNNFFQRAVDTDATPALQAAVAAHAKLLENAKR
jgi:hypothetical protein